MNDTLDTTTVTVQGLAFKVEIVQDLDSREPWKEHDGHGPVREGESDRYTGNMKKRAGEVVLHQGDHNCYSWVYDWTGAMVKAKEEGWGVSRDKRPPGWDALTDPQQREVAVQSDFDFLKAWAENEWVWCEICVTLMVEDEDGDLVEYDGPLTSKFHDSLSRVEYWQYAGLGSKENTYINEIIEEMCGGIASRYLKEVGEQAYWESRDVVTEVA